MHYITGKTQQLAESPWPGLVFLSSYSHWNDMKPSPKILGQRVSTRSLSTVWNCICRLSDGWKQWAAGAVYLICHLHISNSCTNSYTTEHGSWHLMSHLKYHELHVLSMFHEPIHKLMHDPSTPRQLGAPQLHSYSNLKYHELNVSSTFHGRIHQPIARTHSWRKYAATIGRAAATLLK